MSKRQEQSVPPPWNVIGRHEVFPEAKHDEIARFNFLTNMNVHLSQSVLPGMRSAYENRAKHVFCHAHGHEPKTRQDMRHAMKSEPYYQIWSALRRNTMEMRQEAGRSMVLRQIDRLNNNANLLNDNKPTLQLDPELEQPHYMTEVDIHCMPGSYHTALVKNDVSAGANYDCGIFVTTAGMLGQYSDGGGKAICRWLSAKEPQFKPRRILDLGCTVGHNIVPVAQHFLNADVIAVDTAAPVLRYAHARAQSLGVHNITFKQANAEQLDFSDECFDLIITSMFLHELSDKSLPIILKEIHRLLAPNGLVLHLEQPQYTPEMDLYEQFIRDWDTHNNNEPFWGTMHDINIYDAMEKSGLTRSQFFTMDIAAVVDENIFPSAVESEEDYGRRAAWHGFGAWK